MKKFNVFQKLFHKFLSLIFFFNSLFFKIEEYFIKRLLLKKNDRNFLYRLFKANESYLPSSSLQISTLILSRNRLIDDPVGANRIKPKRWIMLNNGIQNELKKYKIKSHKCLSFGGGITNPYSLAILWYLYGSKKIDILEPGILDEISSVTGINELLMFILLSNKKKIKFSKKILDNRISNIINRGAAFNQLAIDKIINKNIINFYNKRIEEYPLKKDYYDLIYSRSTLEHVVNIKKVLQKLYEMQSPTGIAYHDIDFKGHNISDMFWIYYEDWEVSDNNLNGLNGWRLSDYLNFYNEIGAKVIVRKKIIEKGYNLRNRNINTKFNNYDEKDLLTSFARLIIFKK